MELKCQLFSEEGFRWPGRHSETGDMDCAWLVWCQIIPYPATAQARGLLWLLYFYKLDKFCHLSFYLILKWILDTENIQHIFKFLLTVKNVSKYFKVISDNNFIVHRQQFYQFKPAWKRWPYFGLKFWSKIQIFSGVGSNLQGSAVICREKLN